MAQSESLDGAPQGERTAAAALAWLLAAAPAPATAPSAQEDSDLDFLSDVAAPQPVAAPLCRAEADAARLQQAAALIDAGAAEALAAAWPQWHEHAQLAALDLAAALVVLQALLQLPQPRTASHGPLAQLLQRALAGDDRDAQLLAAQAAQRLGLGELQEALAQCLDQHCLALQPQGRARLLDALAELGDGRCVRAMEAFLARWAGALDEHEAWRARHIVQLIRRGGRR